MTEIQWLESSYENNKISLAYYLERLNVIKTQLLMEMEEIDKNISKLKGPNCIIGSHPVFTNRGWKRADEAKSEDVISFPVPET